MNWLLEIPMRVCWTRAETFSNSGNILDFVCGLLPGNGEEFHYLDKSYKKKEGYDGSIY